MFGGRGPNKKSFFSSLTEYTATASNTLEPLLKVVPWNLREKATLKVKKMS